MSKTGNYIRAARKDGGAVFYVKPQDDAFGEATAYPADTQEIGRMLREADCPFTIGRGLEPQLYAGGTYEIQAYSEGQVEAVRRALYTYMWRIAAMVSWPEYDFGGGGLPFAEVPAPPRGWHALADWLKARAGCLNGGAATPRAS